MVQRDYARRRPQNSGVKRKTQTRVKSKSRNWLWLIVILVIIGFATLLYFMVSKSDDSKVVLPPPTTTETKDKVVLPTPPEEKWSYIKDLETREIPAGVDGVDTTEHLTQNNLTEEQKQILDLLDKDKRETVLPRLDRQNQDINKAAEEKAASSSSSKIVSATQNSKNSNYGYGIQCGAFKTFQQADELRAKFALNGYNAKISTSGKWSRVYLGPVGSRNQAESLRKKVSYLANCMVRTLS